jgi:hypothetical protein
MARGRRSTTAAAETPAEPLLTIGFFGSAEVSPDTYIPLLDDLVEGRDIGAVIIPVTNDDFTEEMESIFEWSRALKHPIQIVAVEEADPGKEVTAALGHGYEEFDGGTDVGTTIVDMLSNAMGDVRLVLLLNEDEDIDVNTGIYALETGVDAYNLADGLDVITAAEDGDEEADEAPEAPVVEEPKRGRRGSAAAQAVAEESTPSGHPTSMDDPRMKPEVLKTYLMAELKEIAASVHGADVMTADVLRGKTKDVLVEMVLNGLPGEAAAEEEAPAEPEEAVEPPKRGRRAAAAPDEAQTSSEPQEAEEHPSAGLMDAVEDGYTASTRIHQQDVGGLDEIIAAFAASQRAMAEYIIEEIRKPKPRGRPRKNTDD